MAFRTSEAVVRGLIETDASIKMTLFIRTANTLTDWLENADTDGLLTTGLLREIEAYLAAHFYEANRDRKLSSKSTGGASGSFQGQTAMVLMSTDPGQHACLLDVTGRLAQRSREAQEGMRRTARVRWAGSNTDSTRPDGQSVS